MSLVSRLGYVRLNYKIFLHSTLIIFLTSTILLFLYLNRIQPDYFIDEAFHIPQTLRYCAWNFTQVNITETICVLDSHVFFYVEISRKLFSVGSQNHYVARFILHCYRDIIAF